MNTNDVKLSKSLSWLLRHGALKEGLQFDDGGFVDVEQILKLKQFKCYDLSDIKRVVENNDKKRFSVRYKDCSNNVLQIRANQGHSIPMDDDGLLTLLPEDQVPKSIYHGTYYRNLESIKKVGLRRMNRNHIHFTDKFHSEPGVISGMRKNIETFLVIDTMKAMADGFKFFVSDNGVILCPGNESGILPAIYIKEIWQTKPLKKIQG